MSDRTVTDEQILGSFANLHQAMTTGFDRIGERLDDHERRIRALEARS